MSKCLKCGKEIVEPKRRGRKKEVLLPKRHVCDECQKLNKSVNYGEYTVHLGGF